MDRIGKEQVAELFECVGDIMARNAERLCEMDARMGDGDLGLTMKKGFGALPELIRGIEEEDLGKHLAKAGMKMSSVVPSTMGTLMSSGIMEGGKRLSGSESIGPKELAAFLSGYAAGIQKRGKCRPGDRTVLDAMQPAAEAAQAAADAGATLAEVIRAAVGGADAGVEATRGMTPKFGKAAVFAARAEGVEDQGAVAGQLVVHGLAEYILKESM